LTAKAAADKAGEISTSSTSFEMLPYSLFHSSMKGPLEVSLGNMPTFFCNTTEISSLGWQSGKCGKTYARRFDDIGNFSEEFLVLLGILTTDENFERDLAAFQWLQMLRYKMSASRLPYIAAGGSF
jgi:hypothetical protein